LLCRANPDSGTCHEHIDRQADQFTGQHEQTIPISIGVSVLDRDIRTRSPTECAEATLEYFPSRKRVQRRSIPGGKDADPRHLCPRLRLGGERRNEETARQGAEKRPSIHYSIT
jgi:hypothetical protein